MNADDLRERFVWSITEQELALDNKTEYHTYTLVQLHNIPEPHDIEPTLPCNVIHGNHRILSTNDILLAFEMMLKL